MLGCQLRYIDHIRVKQNLVTEVGNNHSKKVKGVSHYGNIVNFLKKLRGI